MEGIKYIKFEPGSSKLEIKTDKTYLIKSGFISNLLLPGSNFIYFIPSVLLQKNPQEQCVGRQQ